MNSDQQQFSVLEVVKDQWERIMLEWKIPFEPAAMIGCHVIYIIQITDLEQALWAVKASYGECIRDKRKRP